MVIGDWSKYSFLREIVPQIPIPKAQMGDTDIAVTHFNTNGSLVGNQAIELKSDRLPIATEVIFPADNANLENYANKATVAICFEEFEFVKSSTKEKLKYIRDAEFFSVAVVLYAPSRKFLESDISTYDEAIENAKEKYEEDGYIVIEYTPGKNILPLIAQLPSDISVNYHRNRLLKKIAEKRENLYDEDFGLRWDYDLTREDYRCSLSEQDRTLITRYDRQEFERASLDIVYFERARRIIFEKKRNSLIEPLLGVYKNFISNVDFNEFIFWDLNKDIEMLEETIEIQFYKSTFVNHNAIFQGTEIEYGMYENKIKLCSEFYNRIEKFFKETFYEMIAHHIEKRLNKLEKLAKGG